MVLEKIGVPMSRALRDCRARNTNRALRLPRRLTGNEGLGSRHSLSDLQLDGVALHLVVEGGALNTEKFGCFFLVATALCERLENRSSLEIVETLNATAG